VEPPGEAEGGCPSGVTAVVVGVDDELLQTVGRDEGLKAVSRHA
jgi:hypothetical protein